MRVSQKNSPPVLVSAQDKHISIHSHSEYIVKMGKWQTPTTWQLKINKIIGENRIGVVSITPSVNKPSPENTIYSYKEYLDKNNGAGYGTQSDRTYDNFVGFRPARLDWTSGALIIFSN
ncbi:hypothetical protein GWI33_002558 [Rhynchophorus ferrugineus]|uniref:Uncharacterized protein n=1 Tax=Rhynchophorus ferrugineus TaxID=354439 RepID=A0A834IVH0_RHYFE|nr:hypothetical protein GWI33_002558 [Rhynchophorus ferrugineus]